MTNTADNTTASFPRKLLDCISSDFKDAAPGMSSEELREKLVDFERSLIDTQKDMKNDPKLLSLKEDIKAFSEGYKELIKANKASIQYVLYLLESRGVI